MNTGAAISGPTAPKRVVGRPFPKGQSGNPHARPTEGGIFPNRMTLSGRRPAHLH